MDRFAALLEELSPATLSTWLASVPEPDQIAALALLSGHRPKRSVTLPTLRANLGIADWLYDASLAASGDAWEVLALLHPPGPPPGPSLTQALSQLQKGGIETLAPTLPPRAREGLMP